MKQNKIDVLQSLVLFRRQLRFGQILGCCLFCSRTARNEECSAPPGSRLDPEVTIYATLLFQSVGVLHELSVSHFDI